MAKVAVIMGSKSDFEAVRPAIEVLKSFGVETDVRVISAHRTPDLAAAGKAAHLGGVIAAYTPLPVIGLPIKSSTMDGLDSLLSMVQMPSGIPVACVAINGAQNAGLLAVQMLSLKYPELLEKMKNYKVEMAQKISRDDAQLQKELN